MGNIEPLRISNQPYHPPAANADLQQLLAECRQTRRSTVRLLGERSPQGSVSAQIQSNRQGSGASSLTTVLLEAPEGPDERRNSKQEAAASFVSALMQKAIERVEDQPWMIQSGENRGSNEEV